MRRLVVLGDSLAFHGPEGPVPLADERLYPNHLRRRLSEVTGDAWTCTVVARAGWGMREIWLALQRDVHLQQEVLVGADAVVMAAGSVDTLPVGVPRGLLATLPFVRPTPLRRRLRRWIDAVHPDLVRATNARLRYTPRSVYRHAWPKSVDAVRLFTRDAPLCAVLPAVHLGDYYAGSRRHHPEVRRVTAALAAERGVPLVDLATLGEPYLDRMNPDGLHWSWEQHEAVADAMADVLLDALKSPRT